MRFQPQQQKVPPFSLKSIKHEVLVRTTLMWSSSYPTALMEPFIL